MTEENRNLLHHYVESYVYPKMEKGDGPDTQGEREEREDPRGKPPMLELSTFYSVVFSLDGGVLAVDNEDISAYSEEELTRLAEEILSEEKEEGMKERLLYQRKDKGDYILVAFLANYLAGRIVAPLEENYERQKQFISDAGHELKTPAAVISANLELLEREIGETLPFEPVAYEKGLPGIEKGKKQRSFVRRKRRQGNTGGTEKTSF